MNTVQNSSVGAATRQRRKPKRWIPYLGAVLLITLIVAGLWPQPVPVEIAKVSVGRLRASINEEGKTRIKQRFLVSAPLGGQLRRIPFKAGAPVSAGETVVAVIDPLAPALLDARTVELAGGRRDSALANLEKARAANAFAVTELNRFQRLFAEKTVSIQELETIQLRADSAKRDLAAAESALRQAEAELMEFGGQQTNRAAVEVRSPVSGAVLRVFEENSRVVAPGTPLLEVGDPKDLEVVIEVLSRDGATIPAGTPVELDHWGGSEPLQARVRLVEPAAFTKVSALGVEEQRVNVVADIITPVEQRGGLGDAFRVEARIIIWEAENALKVPAGALFRKGDQWATFVLSEGRPHLRIIKTGRSSGKETQVLEGLKEGDQVILYPGTRIREDLRVKPVQI